jgi:hypothetical protein
MKRYELREKCLDLIDRTFRALSNRGPYSCDSLCAQALGKSSRPFPFGFFGGNSWNESSERENHCAWILRSCGTRNKFTKTFDVAA